MFALFAPTAETERENIRQAWLPPPARHHQRHVPHGAGETVEQIRPDLIPTGEHKGLDPSTPGICRALADRDKVQAHPEALPQARGDSADSKGRR